MPPDHWTTAKFRRPGWLPGTVRNSRHNDPTVIILGENLRLGNENQLVKYQRGSYNINKVAS